MTANNSNGNSNSNDEEDRSRINSNNTIDNSNSNSSSSKSAREGRKCKRKRLDPSTSNVVVIGAGLAGLSAALSLRRAGFRHIEVYERDPSLDYQKEGYGLTLTYNPKGPLSDLGVLETVAQKDCPSRSHYLFRQEPPPPESESESESESSQQQVELEDENDHKVKVNTNDNNANVNDNGIPMGYFGNAFFGPSSSVSSATSRRRGYGQRGNLRVPRKVLRRILYEKLLQTQREQQQQQQQEKKHSDNDDDITTAAAAAAVYWNRSLIDFRWDESTQQYHLQFAASTSSSDNNENENENSSTTVATTADLLIAADGIRSTVLQKLYNKKIEEEQPLLTLCSAISSPPLPLPLPLPPPSIRDSPERYGLRSMGIRLILGIADGIDHPLLRERGFYTVDTKGHRLFTMPYQSNRFDDDVLDLDDNTTSSSSDNCGDPNEKKKAKQNRIMWQLSFSTANDPTTLDSASLRQYVLETFQSWHPPVLDLVRSTPPTSIWGTDLMDRDPRQVYQELIVGSSKKNGNGGKGSLRQPRLVVCGDALHSMSPFKGQGANQALADGPLLAKWLCKSSIDAALTNWWREALNRTVPVVEASRKAARDWHDPSRILKPSSDAGEEEYHGFAGVRSSAVPSLVEILRKRKIGPHLVAGGNGELDRRIRDVIQEHGWFDNNGDNGDNDDCENGSGNRAQEGKLTKEPSTQNSSSICGRVLLLAANGDTEGFRKMSLPSSSGGSNHQYCAAMVEARDEQGRSCLHLAAIGNHRFTCQWLLVELRVLEQWDDQSSSSSSGGSGSGGSGSGSGGGPMDIHGRTAYDYAVETGNRNLIHIFEVVMDGR